MGPATALPATHAIELKKRRRLIGKHMVTDSTKGITRISVF
jgi:hypothetical protein